MTGYLTGAQQGRAPFHLLVSLTMCECSAPREVMGTARSVDKLLPAAHGYWDLYMAFWGHLPIFLTVSIVDVRDGAVMWRNGKQLLQEVPSGKESHTGESVRPVNAGRAGRAGFPARGGQRVRWSGA